MLEITFKMGDETLEEVCVNENVNSLAHIEAIALVYHPSKL
jgi:hypothetical protein